MTNALVTSTGVAALPFKVTVTPAAVFTVLPKASTIRLVTATPLPVTLESNGGTPTAMLSTAHHQSLAAVSIPKRTFIVLAPAGLFSGTTTDSLMKSTSFLKFGLSESESKSTTRLLAPPSKATSTTPFWWLIGRPFSSTGQLAPPSSKASGRHVESKATTSELAAAPVTLIAGRAMYELNRPLS